MDEGNLTERILEAQSQVSYQFSRETVPQARNRRIRVSLQRKVGAMPLKSNDQLQALLIEARLSGAVLARAVNQLASENNMTTTYGRAAVSRWLRGIQPRHPAPSLVAEVLSRRLGRTVTPSAAGFGGGQGRAGDPFQQGMDDPLKQLTALAPGTSGSDQGLHNLVYNRAALQVPSWGEIAGTVVHHHRGEQKTPVGRAEVVAATAMTEAFAVSDALTGAGLVRPALSAYLAAPVAGWLRADIGTRIRFSLHSAAARLTYLCGHLCYEDELHGAAQRYFHAALALAAQAGDPTAYALGLRALSMQARHFGHRQQALDLAHAALETPAPAAPQTQALLHSEVAVAHAAAGDRAGTQYHLQSAQARLGCDCRIRIAVGTYYHHADHAQQQSNAHRLLGEQFAAINDLKDSIRRRSAVERRARTIALADLAELQLACGRLDQAIDTWYRFLNNYPTVQCGRVRTALRDMRSRLRTHANHAAARTLLRRADLTAGKTPTPASGNALHAL
ncbi:hypothetical protein [Actinomadura rubrisoli]|uniref:Tetratricopeptide repeat protein n=1 Tax=Actinomadura rubrisoli TaxID=2530368 RepID=A0A4V2YV88_9ACTN|nr:hypothetical protein [Actinomadura rubrisoli]TDD80467.1 hypothetical protein E1298_25715 [Actinomadura rubrisoli]